MENNPLVFVYGTLKKGFGNHALLERNGAKFIGRGRTVSKGFFMTSLGGFPMVSYEETNKLRTPYSGIISGELYEVTRECLEGPLDRLEGYPDFYTRSLTHITVGKTNHKAWIYVNPEGAVTEYGYARKPSPSLIINISDMDKEYPLYEWPVEKK